MTLPEQTSTGLPTDSDGYAGRAMLLTALASVIMIPFAALFIADASSTTPGLMVACGLVGAAGILGLYRFEGGRRWTATLTILSITLFGVIFHSVVAALFESGDVIRAIGALIATVAVFITAYLISLIIRQTSLATLDKVAKTFSICFVAIAALSILDIQPPHTGYSKPIFPFTEPSHFALSFTPFLVYRVVRSSLIVRITWLGIAMLLALLLQSLSLVIGVAVAAACCLSGPILISALIGLSAVIGYLDISYFTDRLDFSTNTTNVSTLVYIQGYELIGTSLKETFGWGIGFQQLGIVPLNVPTSDLIYRIVGNDANIRDGGFTAAKLISEMGIFGIAATFVYLYASAICVLRLRQTAGKSEADARMILCLSAIVGIFIEIFVRGGGYFTGTILFAISATMIAIEEGYFKVARSVAS
ncbi:MAG: hypothetical protein PGN16_19645 [Sphingomonas phyllosphaerae]|uniref:hypothetical protein n=1 Tax=Sphingomonas phyllosphaerae TaxID=257003 RepID=UPI002FF8D633